MSVQHIISIPFDLERSTFQITQDWINIRYKLFHQYTLNSILNQSFQDFRVWIICSSLNPDRTRHLKWHERCELVYDKGKQALQELDTDYVAVTRLDSDDMMHKDAMQEVHDKLVYDPHIRKCLIFRKCIQWSWTNSYIDTFYRSGPPFHTHIFPRRIYKDFKRFCTEHYVSHGYRAGSTLSSAIELSEHKICVIKHDHGVIKLTNPKATQPPIDWAEKEKKLKEGRLLAILLDDVVKILKDFGVKPWMV